jgi:hypothetical protein
MKMQEQSETGFLTQVKETAATVYADAAECRLEKTINCLSNKTMTVTSKSKLKLILAAGGGTAVSFWLEK